MKRLILLITVLFLAGCSTQFAYRNLDWLTYWYLDDYLTLNTEQKNVFDEYLEEWLDWHRTEELPLYVEQLSAIKAEVVERRVTQQTLLTHRQEVQEHWDSLRARMVPDIVAMAPMLSSDQVAGLFEALEERNLEDQNELEESMQNPEEAIEKWIARGVERLEGWMGRLTPEQEVVIERLSSRYTPNRAAWLEYRREYQSTLRALFDQPDRGSEFQERLSELLLNPEVFRSEQLQKNLQSNTDLWIEALTEISQQLSEAQRKRLLRELDDLLSDLEEIVASSA